MRPMSVSPCVHLSTRILHDERGRVTIIKFSYDIAERILTSKVVFVSVDA